MAGRTGVEPATSRSEVERSIQLKLTTVIYNITHISYNNLKKIMIFIASKEQKNTRVDIFLKSRMKEFSRTRIKNIINEGYVKINDLIINEPSKKVKEKDKIEIKVPKCRITSRIMLLSVEPKIFSNRTICPELLIGRNSVMP